MDGAMCMTWDAYWYSTVRVRPEGGGVGWERGGGGGGEDGGGGKGVWGGGGGSVPTSFLFFILNLVTYLEKLSHNF